MLSRLHFVYCIIKSPAKNNIYEGYSYMAIRNAYTKYYLSAISNRPIVVLFIV